MFGRKLKSSMLALALAVPMIGFAQAPPQGPAGPQGPPEWRGQRGPGPGFGQGPGMQRGMRRGSGMHRGRGMRGAGMMRGRGMRQRGMGRMLQDPAMREMLTRAGADPLSSSPEEFSGIIAADIVKWAKVVKAAGVKVQ